MNEAARAAPAARPRVRVTARDRAERRVRIFAQLQEGWTYEAIADPEKLPRERVRQIVAETLAGRVIEPSADHLHLQIARLGRALRLAAQQVAAGELRAVDRLIRVLDRLDKYQGVAAATGIARSPNDDYEQLLEKLARMAARREAGVEADTPAASEAGETPVVPLALSPAGGEAENAISKFFPPEVIENARFGQK